MLNTKRLGLSGVLVMAGLLTACQTTPDIQQLKTTNQNLKRELDVASAEINRLKAQEKRLQSEVAELNRVIGVLGTEKASRVTESSTLRGQVRGFVQQQIDGLKDFLVEGNLLDYVGGELVERSESEVKPLMLVDLGHPIPKAGSLTGVGGHFLRPTKMTVKVLRPVDKKLVVIWQSPLLDVSLPGLVKVPFKVSVGVEPGDVIAYHFPQETAVSFDSGTGNVRYQYDDAALGSVLRPNNLLGESKRRAYALGVYGLLN
ncbi:hypothetical protein R50073_05490 [Maricurvus nonylphenolicus]|uniref:hypothetical protein n=1 Tax=Maricurvus nonylphenolicus TaxID=1008307 RepID=UPI0036F20D10